MRVFLFELSFNVIVLWTRKSNMYDWFFLYSILSVLSVLWCFLSLEDNSGYIKAGYSDVRYKVYIWGFSYLNYSFDVLILRISNLGLYNEFYNIYFTCYIIACHCVSLLRHNFQYLLIDLNFSIHMCLSLHATWHSSYNSLGSFLTPLDFYVKISEFGQMWILLLRTKLTLPLFCLYLVGSWHLLVARDQLL